MVALVAGILGRVDPLLCLGRAMLALLLGWACGQVWYVLFALGGKPKRFLPSGVPGEGKRPHERNAFEGTEGN